MLFGCGNSLKKPQQSEINLTLLKNEYLNTTNYAIFKIKKSNISSNLGFKITNKDTISINGQKVDSVVYIITKDSLNTKYKNWHCLVSEIKKENSNIKYAHLQRIVAKNDNLTFIMY